MRFAMLVFLLSGCAISPYLGTGTTPSLVERVISPPFQSGRLNWTHGAITKEEEIRNPLDYIIEVELDCGMGLMDEKIEVPAHSSIRVPVITTRLRQYELICRIYEWKRK